MLFVTAKVAAFQVANTVASGKIGTSGPPDS
jgi:hypothetical protein